jgi:hypothetical protein
MEDSRGHLAEEGLEQLVVGATDQCDRDQVGHVPQRLGGQELAAAGAHDHDAMASLSTLWCRPSRRAARILDDQRARAGTSISPRRARSPWAFALRAQAACHSGHSPDFIVACRLNAVASNSGLYSVTTALAPLHSNSRAVVLMFLVVAAVYPCASTRFCTRPRASRLQFPRC